MLDPENTRTAKMPKPQSYRILGIDPGSHITGFGCIETPANQAFHFSAIKTLDVGVIQLKKSHDFNTRLGTLHQGFHTLCEKLAPHVVVIEKAFSGVNPHSAIALGAVRGSIISAVKRSPAIKIAEVTASYVKKTVGGNGRASKADLSIALQHLLRFRRGDLPFDASDALAIAVAFSLKPWDPPSKPLGSQEKLSLNRHRLLS